MWSLKILDLPTSQVSTAFVEPPGGTVGSIDWARAGVDQIAFMSTSCGSSFFCRLDLVTGLVVSVTQGYSASWSPDNGKIVFVRDDKIRSINLATGSIANLDGGFEPDWRRF